MKDWKRKTLASGAALLLTGAVFAGCPLKFEKEPVSSLPPATFFETAPPDTTFTNDVFFRWLGTDLDSDVVAFQYQLVETDSLYYSTSGLAGQVIRSLDPRREFQAGDDDVVWSPRVTRNSLPFAGLDDGWFEMRVRSIDQDGNNSESTAARFKVFFDDIAPTVEIVEGCTRFVEGGSARFLLDVSDESRSGAVPRTDLEYSYRLRARSAASCTHELDTYTLWRRFSADTTNTTYYDYDDIRDKVYLVIDGTQIFSDGGTGGPYNDLIGSGCAWEFQLRVRDLAGSVGNTICTLFTRN